MTTLTRQHLTTVLDGAHEDLMALLGDHPEIRPAVHGAATVLATGLAMARSMRLDMIAIAALRASAQMAAQAISGALLRHPEFGLPDSRILDVRNGLETASGQAPQVVRFVAGERVA